MTSIWVQRHTNQPGSSKLCRASVVGDGTYGWINQHQCSRKPVVFRALKEGGEEYGFCKQHDPQAVKHRDQARREQWRKEAEERQASYNREKQTKAAMDACKAAIENIAAGHNDPMTLARETLALFPSHSVVGEVRGGEQ